MQGLIEGREKLRSGYFHHIGAGDEQRRGDRKLRQLAKKA
jgi:hypothetical protein